MAPGLETPNQIMERIVRRNRFSDNLPDLILDALAESGYHVLFSPTPGECVEPWHGRATQSG